jgi:hypothetical protein
MAVVLTNLPKPGEGQRYVDVVIRPDGKEALAVDAAFSGTISLGAVKIADASGSPVANVVPTSGGQNGLVVVTAEVPKSKVTVYGTGMIAPSTTLTLATYTVPSLKRFVYGGAMVGGASSAEFDLRVGMATIAKVRNSGSNRTIVVKFPEEPEASAGTTVEIVAENLSDLARTFEATIFGHTVDI